MVENANHGRMTEPSKSPILSLGILVHSLSHASGRGAATSIAVAQIQKIYFSFQHVSYVYCLLYVELSFLIIIVFV